MILLFGETATIFDSLGEKALQPLSAIVKKEDNGDYRLDLRDTAEKADLYTKDKIIAVDTPWGRQPFRISEIEIKGSKVDVEAWHVFYDSKNYVIEDNYIVDQNANYAVDYLNDNADQTTPFTTTSDVTAIRSLRVVRDTLYAGIKQIVERWGGHLDLDKWEIGISETIGSNRGVSIAYGKNITRYNQLERWDDVATKLLPVGKDGITIDAVYVENDPSDYPVPYTKVLAFEQNDIDPEAYTTDGVLDEATYLADLKSDLQAQAETYLVDNHLPKVNYSIDAYIEGVNDIGDVIKVEHPRLSVPLETNVLAIQYDPISERITKVEFGNFNPRLENFSQTTTAQIEASKETSEELLTSNFNQSLLEATSAISSIMEDSFVIYDGDQIMIVDALPKESAVNVMRINSGGIGFSTTGIEGTFSSAWTIDGTLDMQVINVLNLVADRIKGGTLRIGFYEGNSGLIEIYDEYGNEVGQIDENGIVLSNPNGDRLEISPVEGLSAYSSISGTEEEVFSIDRDVTDVAKLNAREQIQMTPIKIVPIASGSQAGWAFVKLDEGA